MQPKMPVWMHIVFGVELLAALAFAALAWFFSQMFAPKPLDLALFAMVFGPVLITLLCGWLTRITWSSGRHFAAKTLIFAPIACWILFFLGSAIVMGR